MNTDFLKRLANAIISLFMAFLTFVSPFVVGTPEYKEIKEIKKNQLVLTDNFTVTAHAGAMKLPANSLGALVFAVCCGADVVEMDLSYRPDGTPVIIHDPAPGADAGVLLDNAFAVVALSSKTKINLDTKSLQNLPEVYRLIVKHNLRDRVFFTGVDERIAAMINADCPVPYYLTCSIDPSYRDSREYAQKIADRSTAGGFIGINCNFEEISRTVVEVMHENGLLVSVWTVNETLDMYRLLAISVDNITTLSPNMLRLIIKTWK